MIDNVLIESEKLIDRHIDVFNNVIDNEISIDNKAIHPDKTDFPIFRINNNAFFEYKYYEGILEWKIRDYLVTGIIQDLFMSNTVSPNAVVYPNHDDNRNVARFSFSNWEFGDRYYFAFILETDKERVGIRYTDIPIDRKELKLLFSKYNINHIIVIDWSDTDATESRIISCNREEVGKYIEFMTLRQFFIKYFSDELYGLYLSKVRMAVSEANIRIGLHTIPSFSPRYISEFKEKCLKSIINTSISNWDYYLFDNNGRVTTSVSNRLPQADYDVMNRRFYDGELYSVLVGDSKFAQCFLTAEYLYSVFKDGNNIRFDYTSVVTGYFKSVELLLYKISRVWLEKNRFKGLWIAKNQKNIKNIRSVKWCRNNPDPKANKLQVEFSLAYEKYFSTEMGALIWLLHDNHNGWNVSEEGKSIIHDNLWNYKQGCRNDYLHKDIIGNMDTVECIRNNTLLCLYYLLGGCSITDNTNDDRKILGLGDTEYERFYNAMLAIPCSTNCFLIQMDKKEAPFKAIRLFDQSRTEYDEQGNIITPIVFILVNEYSEANHSTNDEYYEMVKSHRQFELNRNSIPYKISWYHRQTGENQIHW